MAVLVALTVAAIAGCGSADGSAAGLVTDIDTLGLGRVQAFTLRTDDGTSLRFTVRDGPDLSSGGLPADHLREHMATGSGVAVAYRADGDTLVVLRLTDAPWVGR
jgi:hypothetical protein